MLHLLIFFLSASDSKGQANKFLKDESQSLEDRYRLRSSTDVRSLVQGSQNENLYLIMERCREFDSLEFSSATMIAVQNVDEKVVQLLLGRDGVNPDSEDEKGRTPLWWAEWGGYRGVARRLLERNDVGQNAYDEDGETHRRCLRYGMGMKKWCGCCC